MRWFWRKKVEKQKPLVLTAPDEYTAELFELYDATKKGGRLATFKLWKRIMEIMPQVNYQSGTWRIVYNRVTKFQLEKVEDEETT